jgi:hypothetical protein
MRHVKQLDYDDYLTCDSIFVLPNEGVSQYIIFNTQLIDGVATNTQVSDGVATKPACYYNEELKIPNSRKAERNSTWLFCIIKEISHLDFGWHERSTIILE